MEIQRLTQQTSFDGLSHRMIPFEHGEYVAYSQHLASLAAQQEEIDRLKEENAKLQARLDAMSAPVSDEEMIAHAIHWIDVVQPKRRLPVLTDTQVNMLLAARAKTEATG